MSTIRPWLLKKRGPETRVQDIRKEEVVDLWSWGNWNWSPGLLAQKEETGDPAYERLGIGLRCSMEVFQVLAHR